ncbi:MAG: ERCC4 domain-containing protein [Kiritimatiellia bacterium]|jgi:ERCC4-type nuclease|nr:ERCC4 domain-containing protein [Kiritimatiellia bacterium]
MAMTEAAKIPLRIVCDSREQQPFTFDGFPVVVTPGTLASGDYSLHGFTDRIAVERKSLPDLLHSISKERERFERELQRLKAHDFACVLVEANVDDLRAGQYRAKLNPEAAWQSVLAFTQRYRIPFIWSESRADAEQVAFDFLRHFARDRWRELQALDTATHFRHVAGLNQHHTTGESNHDQKNNS